MSVAAPDPAPAPLPRPSRHVALDVTLGELLPGRALRLTALGVDAVALRLWYEVTPPLAPVNWDDVRADEAADGVWFLWGSDDRGNEYLDGGGAHGPTADGRRTEGVHSLLPLPAADAAWLDLAFASPRDAQPFEWPRYTLRVHLPLVVDPPRLGPAAP